MVERESTTQLADRVEIDDAYLGGESSGGKAGRGSESKVPFIAAVEKNLKAIRSVLCFLHLNHSVSTKWNFGHIAG